MKKTVMIFMGMLLYLSMNAQCVLSGTVLDETKKPLAGVSIHLQNTQMGTTSDAEGKFRLTKIPKGIYTIVFSMVGYETQNHKIELSDQISDLTIQLKLSVNQLEEFTIESTRADEKTGIAFTNVDKSSIEKNNLGVDLPYLLDQTPSVVVTSDAGTGIGYTGIRIRGSDPTRINMTINGIPLNDAESQGTYWVDLPDFASSVDNIQIQRGVGTSTNGAGAFGGSVNLQTNTVNEKPYASFGNSFGSFNTLRNNLKVGTGLIDGKFSFDARLSSLKSDGYIDRAFSDLKSFYTSSAWFGKKSSVRLNIFSGKERTYQAWGGVPYDSLETNPTFNPYSYKNETDNYWQTHYQLFYNQQFKEKWFANIALHYTRGYGYYEQYKTDKSFYEIGVPDPVIGGDTILYADMIQQKWLDNHFFGTVYSLRFQPNEKLNLVAGGGWNEYRGYHYGRIIWSEISSGVEKDHEFYRDTATKRDANVYLRANYDFNEKLSFYIDVQERLVSYTFLGFGVLSNDSVQTVKYNFFNPKAGISYSLSKQHAVYASYGRGNKEPNRDDFVSSRPGTYPKPEQMDDIEAGYRFRSGKLNVGINIYYMIYKNQLALTGKINDVGNYIRTNIDKSFRRGAELDLKWQIHKRLSWAGNITLSQNKVVQYKEFIDNWDTWSQDTIEYKNTELAFSPSVIGGQELTFNLFEKSSSDLNQGEKAVKQRLDISFISKYVGKQYTDNSVAFKADSDPLFNSDLKFRTLNAYFLNDLRLSYSFIRNEKFEIKCNALMRNMFDLKYASNAWIYKYSYGGMAESMTGFYPQAGRNFLIGITIGF